MGVSVLASGINLFLITLGYRAGGVAPIYTHTQAETVQEMVLPVPQALTLTSIVIAKAFIPLLEPIAAWFLKVARWFNVA